MKTVVGGLSQPGLRRLFASPAGASAPGSVEIDETKGLDTGAGGLYVKTDSTLDFDGSGNLVATNVATGRVQARKGSDLASAATLTLGTDGNVFSVTGTTALSFITTTGWQAGSQVVLILPSGIRVVHGATGAAAGTAPLALATGFGFTTIGTATLCLAYDGAAWREIGQPRGIGVTARQQSEARAAALLESPIQGFHIDYFQSSTSSGNDTTYATEGNSSGSVTQFPGYRRFQVTAAGAFIDVSLRRNGRLTLPGGSGGEWFIEARVKASSAGLLETTNCWAFLGLSSGVGNQLRLGQYGTISQTNWIAYGDGGAVSINSGVAIDTNWHTLTLLRLAGTTYLFIDHVLVGTAAGVYPSVDGQPYLLVQTGAALTTAIGLSVAWASYFIKAI
jgi:hypothetical protein